MKLTLMYRPSRLKHMAASGSGFVRFVEVAEKALRHVHRSCIVWCESRGYPLISPLFSEL